VDTTVGDAEPAGDPEPAAALDPLVLVTEPDRDPAPATRADGRTDGRAARATRTRTQIVDALLSLLEEGDLQPPASRIAERAGISLRLIYHHFGDLESLFRATASREAERVAARITPIDMDLPLEARIDAIVEQRTSMLEWMTPVRRAALLQEPFSDELTAARVRFAAAAEAGVRHVFARELDQLDEVEREEVVTTVHGALLWGLWNDLRTNGRDELAARAAVRRILRALLLR